MTGFVQSWLERDAVVGAIRGTRGVRQVVNAMEENPQPLQRRDPRGAEASGVRGVFVTRSFDIVVACRRPDLCIGPRGDIMRQLPNGRVGRPRIAIGRANGDGRSGDCARVFVRPQGAVLCFLGDVSGHDAQAATLARELESFVCARADRMAPGRLLSQINSELAAAWAPDLFVSALCFSFDSHTGRGTIAVAGQLPPLVKSRWTTSALDVTVGAPLGVLPDQCYGERDFCLSAGELLVAVTDGITDPLAGDLLGMAVLARLVARAPVDPVEVCASLLRSVEGSERSDDATVLAVASAQTQLAVRSYVPAWPARLTPTQVTLPGRAA